MTDPAQLLRDAGRLITIGDNVNRTATELESECTEGRHTDLKQTRKHIRRLHDVCNQIASLTSGLVDMAGRGICSHK